MIIQLTLQWNKEPKWDYLPHPLQLQLGNLQWWRLYHIPGCSSDWVFSLSKINVTYTCKWSAVYVQFTILVLLWYNRCLLCFVFSYHPSARIFLMSSCCLQHSIVTCSSVLPSPLWESCVRWVGWEVKCYWTVLQLLLQLVRSCHVHSFKIACIPQHIADFSGTTCGSVLMGIPSCIILDC